jgi:decaprenyl-phosphate phosphoribosyltransferase
MRPEHYVKNLFMYLPLFFSFQLFDARKLAAVSIGFAAFSLTASSIYIFNDIKDVEFDRNHPRKKQRPIASGEVSVKTAFCIMIPLLVAGTAVAFLLNVKFFAIMLLYLVINAAYSLGLKHISFIDIIIIAAGFVLRIFAGAAIIDNNPSMWIILLTFMLALFMAIAKRREDVLLSDDSAKTRRNVDGYNLELINAGMIIMATVTIVSYIMYTISAEVIARLKTDRLYITVVFVILGILRYMQLTFVYERSGSPVRLLIEDHFLKITIILWLLTFIIILYWNTILKIIGM